MTRYVSPVDEIRDQAIRAVQSFGCTCTPKVKRQWREGDLLRVSLRHGKFCRYDPASIFNPPDDTPDEETLDRQRIIQKKATAKVRRKAKAVEKRNK